MNGFYAAFEARHRGSREDVKSRLWVYGPFLDDVRRTAAGAAAALDLGCGRGEWLEILREVGIEARGVDLDADAVADCTSRGLAARREDALEALRAAPDASLDLVTAFHVVEHLAFPQAQALIAEALRALRPAGLLILETPNPENLWVGSHRFYLDPTHDRPVPPELLDFLAEHAGFRRTKVMRLQEPPELGGNASPSLRSVLTEVSPDYGLVAQKDADEGMLALFDLSFSRHYGVSLHDLTERYDFQRAHRDRDVQSRLAALEDATRRIDARAAEAEERLRLTQESLSWRLTAPLRWLAARLKAFTGR